MIGKWIRNRFSENLNLFHVHRFCFSFFGNVQFISNSHFISLLVPYFAFKLLHTPGNFYLQPLISSSLFKYGTYSKLTRIIVDFLSIFVQYIPYFIFSVCTRQYSWRKPQSNTSCTIKYKEKQFYKLVFDSLCKIAKDERKYDRMSWHQV